MVTKVRALYQNGLLRPLTPVDWPEEIILEISAEPVRENGDVAFLEPGANGDETLEKLLGFDPNAEYEREEQTLAEALGLDPKDEAKSAELAESQYRAILSTFPLVDRPDVVIHPEDIDASLYS
jgi:predicted DNA-binding antitoxin AbrB/MazE fold protein